MRAWLCGSPDSRIEMLNDVSDSCGQPSCRRQRDSSPGVREDELRTGGGHEPRLSVIGFS